MEELLRPLTVNEFLIPESQAEILHNITGISTMKVYICLVNIIFHTTVHIDFMTLKARVFFIYLFDRIFFLKIWIEGGKKM